METVRIVLRVVHIIAGTLWVGGAFFNTLFLEPTVRAAGAEGGRFMERLLTETPIIKYMTIASLVTVISGIILYGLDIGYSAGWVTSRQGLIFSIGSVAGLVAYVAGQFVIAPTVQRIGLLGKEMVVAGGPPLSGQVTEMSSLQARAVRYGLFEITLMAISVAGMAGARIF